MIPSLLNDRGMARLSYPMNEFTLGDVLEFSTRSSERSRAKEIRDDRIRNRENTPSCKPARRWRFNPLPVVECPSTMPIVQKSAKKRPAPSQDGPKFKKAHISKQATSKHSDESIKKRRQPVTLPVEEIEEEDSDEEFGDVESGEGNAEESPANDEMHVDSGLSKDPNGSPLGALAVLISLMRRMN